MDFIEIAKNAKTASIKAQKLSNDVKNSALTKIAESLEAHKSEVFDANKQDMIEAKALLDSSSYL